VPSDGLYYSRRNAAWAVTPGAAIATDAPSDGKSYGRVNATWSLVAPLNSPVLTGNPQAPTPASTADNSTSLATTAWVKALNYALASSVPVAATAAEYRSNSAPAKMLTPGAVWSAAALVTVSEAAGVVTLDLNAGFDFFWTLTAAGRTMANPTGGKSGQKGFIYLAPGTAGTVTTWGSNWKFPGGIKPTLTLNGADIISYMVGSDNATMLCTFAADFK
jgi:hypothetical protein